MCTAHKQLIALEQILYRDPNYAQLYYKEMQRFIDMGYVQAVNKTIEPTHIWYLPHFGIYNANKPDKVRIVFDVAAKTFGMSLNAQLEYSSFVKIASGSFPI